MSGLQILFSAALLAIVLHPASVQARDLDDCPDKPNCVSSTASDPARQIQPLRFRGSAEEAMQHLLSLLRSDEQVWIVGGEGGYLHVTYTSNVFEFVDDVEFAFDDNRQMVDVRSASRTGYWDLGANRRRIESLRNAFESKWFDGEPI